MRDTVLVISAALALVDAWLVVRVMRFLGGPQQVFGAQVEGRVGHGLATMGSPFDWKMLGRGLVGIPGGYAVVGVFDPIAVSAHRLASILADLETRSPWPVPYVPAVVMTGKDADRFARDRLKHPGPCVVMAARARNAGVSKAPVFVLVGRDRRVVHIAHVGNADMLAQFITAGGVPELRRWLMVATGPGVAAPVEGTGRNRHELRDISAPHLPAATR